MTITEQILVSVKEDRNLQPEGVIANLQIALTSWPDTEGGAED